MNFRKTLLEATRYFAIVFAIGFLLGVIRTLFLIPQFGESTAELLEMPWMMVAVFVVARWLFPASGKTPFTTRQRISIGTLALSYLLVAELGVMVFIRHQGIGEYISGRDPVVFGVYLATLGLFAAMPCLIACRNKGLTIPVSARPDGRAARQGKRLSN